MKLLSYLPFKPHGLVLIDTKSHQAVQRIGLKSTVTSQIAEGKPKGIRPAGKR